MRWNPPLQVADCQMLEVKLGKGEINPRGVVIKLVRSGRGSCEERKNLSKERAAPRNPAGGGGRNGRGGHSHTPPLSYPPTPIPSRTQSEQSEGSSCDHHLKTLLRCFDMPSRIDLVEKSTLRIKKSQECVRLENLLLPKQRGKDRAFQ